MVVRDLACHVISLNAGCLWVTPSAIPGLHGRIEDTLNCFQDLLTFNVIVNEVYISGYILSEPSMKHGRVKIWFDIDLSMPQHISELELGI